MTETAPQLQPLYLLADSQLLFWKRQDRLLLVEVFTGRFTLGIASPEARAVLAIAPTPASAAKLSVSRIAAALRRAGRSRGIDQAAAEVEDGLRKPQLRQPLLVETAMGKNALALLAALDTACVNVDELGQASAELFRQHPDYAIVTSFPGLADSTGARLLADPTSGVGEHTNPEICGLTCGKVELAGLGRVTTRSG
ncbi:MAG TPA: hypothetical protein VEF72_29765 [Mycobacterium sp.]|nr:hypothetical protein [Mycobacterium sp.]